MVFGFVKKVFKGVTKAVKKVAKGVVKLGRGIVKGVGKIYSKTFGKLGPLGAIAASFIMPGLGNMLGSMWTSAASSLSASSVGWIKAVGEGMASLGGTVGSITDTISTNLSKVGNTISDGAKNLFNSAKETVTSNVDFSSLTDIGKKVADGAKKIFNTTPESPFDLETDNLFELTDRGIAEATSNAAPGSFQLNDIEGLNIVDVDPSLVPNAGADSPFKLPTISEIKAPGQEQFNLGKVEDPAGFVTGITPPDPITPATPNTFKDRLAKAAKSLLTPPTEPQTLVEPFFTGTSIEQGLVGSQRGGIAGKGAGQGDFLTPQQRQFFEQQRQRLGVLG